LQVHGHTPDDAVWDTSLGKDGVKALHDFKELFHVAI
jgi:hypothetical protein